MGVTVMKVSNGKIQMDGGYLMPKSNTCIVIYKHAENDTYYYGVHDLAQALSYPYKDILSGESSAFDKALDTACVTVYGTYDDKLCENEFCALNTLLPVLDNLIETAPLEKRLRLCKFQKWLRDFVFPKYFNFPAAEQLLSKDESLKQLIRYADFYNVTLALTGVSKEYRQASLGFWWAAINRQILELAVILEGEK